MGEKGGPNHEAVVLLTANDLKVEHKAVDCISKVIREVLPAVRLIPADEYRALLGNEPTLREQMASLHIRYLVAVSGRTQQSWKGYGGCGGGYGAAGCLILEVGDRQSRLVAWVLDLKQAGSVGEVHASVSGRP